MTDALGGVIRYTYDDAHRRTQTTLPDGKTQTITYDEAGRPVRMKTFDGLTIENTYDAMGRIISTTSELIYQHHYQTTLPRIARTNTYSNADCFYSCHSWQN